MTEERQRAALAQLRLGIQVQATGEGYANVDYVDLERLAEKNESLLGDILVLDTVHKRRIVALEVALARAAYIAGHLMDMIPQDTWREQGGDDGQGHYEGDYHAAQTAEEIRGWKALSASPKAATTAGDEVGEPIGEAKARQTDDAPLKSPAAPTDPYPDNRALGIRVKECGCVGVGHTRECAQGARDSVDGYRRVEAERVRGES